MTEPGASLAVVFFGVPLLAQRAALVIELVTLEELVSVEPMDAATGAACRFGAHPSERAGAVISRPR